MSNISIHLLGNSGLIAHRIFQSLFMFAMAHKRIGFSLIKLGFRVFLSVHVPKLRCVCNHVCNVMETIVSGMSLALLGNTVSICTLNICFRCISAHWIPSFDLVTSKILHASVLCREPPRWASTGSYMHTAHWISAFDLVTSKMLHASVLCREPPTWASTGYYMHFEQFVGSSPLHFQTSRVRLDLLGSSHWALASFNWLEEKFARLCLPFLRDEYRHWFRGLKNASNILLYNLVAQAKFCPANEDVCTPGWAADSYISRFMVRTIVYHGHVDWINVRRAFPKHFPCPFSQTLSSMFRALTSSSILDKHIGSYNLQRCSLADSNVTSDFILL